MVLSQISGRGMANIWYHITSLPRMAKRSSPRKERHLLLVEQSVAEWGTCPLSIVLEYPVSIFACESFLFFCILLLVLGIPNFSDISTSVLKLNWIDQKCIVTDTSSKGLFYCRQALVGMDTQASTHSFCSVCLWCCLDWVTNAEVAECSYAKTPV